MKVWIALLRGVNVGGRKLNMKQFASALEKAGLTDVRTYIQSGNVVFRAKETRAAALSALIERCVEKVAGFSAAVQVIPVEELRKAARDNPFLDAASVDHKSVHLFFLLEKAPASGLATLEALKTDHEDFTLKGGVFYLYSRDGLSASKLAEKAGRLLGARATARNWRTVSKLIEMASEE
jgi:uncharacterized protein (DUF1697 family)